MNVTSLFLGMLSVVLLMFLLFSLRDMNSGGSSTAEHDLLRREIQELRDESKTLRLQAALRRQPPSQQIYQAPAPQPTLQAQSSPSPPLPTKPVDDALAEQIAELQAQLDDEKETSAQLAEKAEKAERKKDVAEKEAGMAWEERTKVQQKAERGRRHIEMALTMGTVTEVNTEYGFLVFTPSGRQQFQSDQVLGIRRNSGILGTVRVDRDLGGSFSANMMPNAYAGGIPPVEAGDELIILPDTYRVPGSESAPSPAGGGASISEQPLIELLGE